MIDNFLLPPLAENYKIPINIFWAIFYIILDIILLINFLLNL